VLYTGGLPGVPVPGGVLAEASVDLYLYDDATGQPMTVVGGSSAVCAPCSFTVSSSARKRSIRLDDLISPPGSPAGVVKLGFGIMVVGGANPENVQVSSVVNANAGKNFELSVFGFDPVILAVP
jgi:hypothetical protein